ncbi:MAG: NAD-dependent epimerase/dehydratase family protein, partial [Solirubrobacteraceae bacterium]
MSRQPSSPVRANVLVTGSDGHLGEALMRRLPEEGHEARGLDVRPGAFVDVVGSVAEPAVVRDALDGIDVVLHAATLHKPHVGSHPRSAFVETNVTGTRVLLEEAVRAGVRAFVFTSTTSMFGRAMRPADGEPAAWITEDVVPRPRNVYGATKVAPEGVCELVHRNHGLPVAVLRTARFFPEPDDVEGRRDGYSDLNLKVLELLHRRVDLEDVVTAHLRALHRAPAIGFGRYIVSATTPLHPSDAGELRRDAAGVIARRCAPATAAVFAYRDWSMPADIERVYVNDRARAGLGWEPRYTFF